MDRIRGEGFTEENQTEICTEECASLHSSQGMHQRNVNLYIRNTYKKRHQFFGKNKKADGRYCDHPLFNNGLNRFVSCEAFRAARLPAAQAPEFLPL